MSIASIPRSVENRVVEFYHQVPSPPALPRVVYKGISILLFLALWWVLVLVEFLGFGLIPTPLETVTALYGFILGEPVTQGGVSLYVHSYHTLVRVTLGICLGVALALPLGLLIGWSEWYESYLYPAFELLRPIPPVAWVPIALIAFATELMSIVWVVFVGVFFPILINTIDGVKAIETDYVRAVQSLGGSRFDLFRHVIVPAAMPSMITGMMTGIGVGWIAVVAAEMIAGNYGVGYFTYQAYRLMNTQTVVIGIIVLGAYGAASSYLAAKLGNLLMPWDRSDAR